MQTVYQDAPPVTQGITQRVNLAAESIFSLFPREIVSLAFSFLPYHEQIQFRLVCHIANDLINSPYHFDVLRKRLQEIPEEINDRSLSCLQSECMKLKRVNGYSDTLIKYWGGITKILELPLTLIKKDLNSSNYFQDLEKLAHLDEFKKVPNIIRCRFESSPDVEVIIMNIRYFFRKK